MDFRIDAFGTNVDCSRVSSPDGSSGSSSASSAENSPKAASLHSRKSNLSFSHIKFDKSRIQQIEVSVSPSATPPATGLEMTRTKLMSEEEAVKLEITEEQDRIVARLAATVTSLGASVGGQQRRLSALFGMSRSNRGLLSPPTESDAPPDEEAVDIDFGASVRSPATESPEAQELTDIFSAATVDGDPLQKALLVRTVLERCRQHYFDAITPMAATHGAETGTIRSLRRAGPVPRSNTLPCLDDIDTAGQSIITSEDEGAPPPPMATEGTSEEFPAFAAESATINAVDECSGLFAGDDSAGTQPPASPRPFVPPIRDALFRCALDFSYLELPSLPMQSLAAEIPRPPSPVCEAIEAARRAEVPGVPPKLRMPTLSAILVELNVSNNQLSALPDDLGALQALKRLIAKRNRLTFVPASLCMCEELEFLDLSNNLLDALPAELGDLPALHELLLDYNRFAAPPACVFSGLPELRRLSMIENAALTRLVPETFEATDEASLCNLWRKRLQAAGSHQDASRKAARSILEGHRATLANRSPSPRRIRASRRLVEALAESQTNISAAAAATGSCSSQASSPVEMSPERGMPSYDGIIPPQLLQTLLQQPLHEALFVFELDNTPELVASYEALTAALVATGAEVPQRELLARAAESMLLENGSANGSGTSVLNAQRSPMDRHALQPIHNASIVSAATNASEGIGLGATPDRPGKHTSGLSPTFSTPLALARPTSFRLPALDTSLDANGASQSQPDEGIVSFVAVPNGGGASVSDCPSIACAPVVGEKDAPSALVRVQWNKIWPDDITECVCLGSLRTVQNLDTLHALGITHVLTCGRNLDTPVDFVKVFAHKLVAAKPVVSQPQAPPEQPRRRRGNTVTSHKPHMHERDAKGRKKIQQLVLEVDDNESESLEQYFMQAINFIEEASRTGGKTLVHCFAGVSRSATVVVAYVMFKRDMTAKESLRFVQKHRACANPNSNFRKQLEHFDDYLNGRSPASPQLGA